MGFAAIGSWLDNKITSAHNTWRGSEAKKTIDDVMERSKQAAESAKDKVFITVTEAKENFNKNIGEINTKHNDGTTTGFFKSAYQVGKNGGLIGMMLKKEEKPAVDEKPVQTQQAPTEQTEKAEVKPTNLRPIEQDNGWNLAK